MTPREEAMGLDNLRFVDDEEWAAFQRRGPVTLFGFQRAKSRKVWVYESSQEEAIERAFRAGYREGYACSPPHDAADPDGAWESHRARTTDGDRR